MQEALLLGLPVAVLIILFSLANLARLGINEYYFANFNGFFWTRRLWLLLPALIGICALMHTASPWRAIRGLGWSLNRPVMTAAILLGLIVGAISPTQRVDGSVAIVISMTVLHVLSEVLFFQGLVTRVLWRHVPDPRIAMVISGIVYGAHRLTFYSYWYQMDLIAKFHWTGGAILLVGIPAAWMYTSTRSILHPLVFQALIHMVMLGSGLWA